MTFNPYAPSFVFDEDQVDELADHADADSKPAHEIANDLGRAGSALFPGANPNAIPGLDAGEPAGLAPKSAVVAPAGAELVVGGQMLPAGPSIPQADGDGLELLGGDDLIIPRLRVKQPMTEGADQVPEGNFFLSTDPDDFADSRELVVLQVTPKRELKLPIDDEKKANLVMGVESKLGRKLEIAEGAWSLCSSADRIKPDGDAPLAASCAACPFGTWRKEGGKNVRECQEIYEVAVADLETLQPIVYTLRGAASKPAKKLNSMLVMKLRRLKGAGKAWGFSTKVTLDRIVGKKKGQGHYYAPNFGRLETIEDAGLIAELGELRADLIGARVAPDVA